MSAIWAVIPNWLKIVAAAVLAVFLCLAVGYVAGTIKERHRSALAAAEATAKAIQKRADIDEEVINMDAYRLCLELGGVREQCDQLRGLEASKR
ncbi:hypothetical protein [Ochrobactrum sp. Marseille-Q0166]|uniref:hypothetical protein n=1 Tax=Ochrobactrum sp. Marseille-Q0166 TaxID=2761105 RepID=UPI001656683E|nr:hypothetical protein [Ochrobactrum sp. Marseille-Q0166]MBC8718843.1 hypothetical protein [Ochrobactrum sp. Marseille-Q0166]